METLSHYDEIRRALLAWLATHRRFAIIDVPLFDGFPSATRAAVLLDAIDEGFIRYDFRQCCFYFDGRGKPVLTRRCERAIDALADDTNSDDIEFEFTPLTFDGQNRRAEQLDKARQRARLKGAR